MNIVTKIATDLLVVGICMQVMRPAAPEVEIRVVCEQCGRAEPMHGGTHPGEMDDRISVDADGRLVIRLGHDGTAEPQESARGGEDSTE